MDLCTILGLTEYFIITEVSKVVHVMARVRMNVIDVSDFQGRIDWERVKNDGIDGAIIRAAYSTVKMDSECDRNIEQCERYDIPFGLYIYSLAKTRDRARKEAEILRHKAKGHRIEFPLYIDLENPGYGRYAHMAAKEFGDVIERSGYWAGVYANLNWWEEYLRDTTRYTRWVARYGGKPDVPDMDMWQYTSTGRVDGIDGYCDRNRCYVDFPRVIRRSRRLAERRDLKGEERIY